MLRFSDFRDNYCKHQAAYLSFEGEEAVKACSYKEGKVASAWSDWQPCTSENCPALKEIKEARVPIERGD